MVIRFYDIPYHTFSFLSAMVVVCPKCGKAGVVHFDTKRNTALFQCRSCSMKKETVPGGNDDFEVTAHVHQLENIFVEQYQKIKYMDKRYA